MKPLDDLEEIQAAGVEFRSGKPLVTPDDLEEMLKARVLEVSNAPVEHPRLPTPEELRERAERQATADAKLAAKRAERRKLDREIRSERWKTLVPGEWSSATLEVLPQPIAEAVQKWIDLPEGERWSLVMFGSTGVGKTYASYAAVRELYLDRYDIEMVEVPSMMDSLRPGSDDAAKVLDRLRRVEVLALDDLGSERVTEWTTERLDMIINHRWQHRLATVATTNIAPTELKDRFGERTTSRLLGGSVLIKVAGKDKRFENG